ncbi:TPA: pilin N-terminal domain-containing protein [Enterococcus faecium]
MKKRGVLVCATVLFSSTAYTQLTFADNQESMNSTEQTSQTTDGRTKQSSDEIVDSSTIDSPKEPTNTEESQQLKQTIHIQKVISSEQLDNQGNPLEKQEGVNGAKFVIYDVTEFLQKMIREEKWKHKPLDKVTTLLKERVKKLAPDQLKKVTEGKTSTVAQQDGILEFSVEVPANQKQAYYIVNESSPENVSNSEATLLILPVSNEEGELMKDSWIYPKSQVSTPKIEKRKIVSTGIKQSFWSKIIQSIKDWWDE